MTGPITFTLDGVTVEAQPGESIWEVAKREGTTIPHLCHKDAPGYRSDGNCRACMVEIEGERTLAASCIREPRDGMVVNSAGDRPTRARKMVMEMLVADQPELLAGALRGVEGEGAGRRRVRNRFPHSNVLFQEATGECYAVCPKRGWGARTGGSMYLSELA